MLKLFKSWRFPLALLLAAIAWAAALHKGLPERVRPDPEPASQLSAATSVAQPLPAAPAHVHKPSSMSLPAAEQLKLLLSRHHTLAEKALPLGDERAELEALLASHDNLELVRARLLAAPRTPLDMHDQDERLQAVAFLRDALRFKANPSRTETISVVSEVILAGNHRAVRERDVRRSSVADKIDLFQALAAYAPSAAHELEHSGATRENHKLLEYAAQLAQNSPSVE